jgi:hypothetical protein
VKAARFGALAIPALVLVIGGCESLGLKANITSWKSVNGETTVKHREAKNWDEFKSAMGEVGTDFSDVAKAVGANTAALAKALVDAPPPGEIKLGELSPSLKRFEGNEQLDFIAAARKEKKTDAGYDFTYVRIGVPSYDDFFKAAAETYSLAFQMKETARRVRLISSALSGDKADENAKVADAVDKTKKAQATDDNKDAVAYGSQLVDMWSTLGSQGAQLVAKTAELVSKGQALIVGAPSSITNPKTVLHIKLIIKGLEDSISLIKDSAKIMGDLLG